MNNKESFVYCSEDEIEIIKIISQNATITIATEFRDTVLKLVKSGRSKIILDLSATDLMDSTFLGALVVSYKACKSNNGTLLIAAMRDSVSVIFGLTKLINVLPTFDSVEKAMENIKNN